MSKAMILNRLARAMETLGRREGRSLTPRQRVAAAQRWNSLAGIGMNEYDDRYNRFIDANKYDMAITRDEELKLRKEAEDAYRAMRDLGISSTTYPFESGWSEYADNPFRFDWMGEPSQYEARLRNYRPLTDAQYERMLEIEDEARRRELDAIYQEWYDDFIEPWRH